MSEEMINNFKVNYDDSYNPTIKSPAALFALQFYETEESLMDVDEYKKFLDNAISRFRHSRTYKQYKSYLMDLGMDRCQLIPGINSELEDISKLIEMHHNFLTIFDIALLITEHVIKTKGFISTFDLVQLLKEEHKANRIPLVMLCKTAHQMYHNNEDFMIPASMCFGFWQELLQKYNKGITKDIAEKTLIFLQKSLDVQNLNIDFTNNLLQLRDDIIKWSDYNDKYEFNSNMHIGGITYY